MKSLLKIVVTVLFILFIEGCATLSPPKSPDLRRKEFDRLALEGGLDVPANCYKKSFRAGALIIDILLFYPSVFTSVIIDAAKGNWTYYAFNRTDSECIDALRESHRDGEDFYAEAENPGVANKTAATLDEPQDDDKDSIQFTLDSDYIGQLKKILYTDAEDFREDDGSLLWERIDKTHFICFDLSGNKVKKTNNPKYCK